MTRYTLLLAVLLTASCSQPGPVAGGPTTQAVALFPDSPETLQLGALQWRGGINISDDDARFGGLSALETSAGGARLLAVSDSAWWVTTDLIWSEAGELSGVDNLVIAPLLGREGNHLEGEAGDSEGIAALGDGHYAVSFERQARIWSYDLGENWERIDRARPSLRDLPPTELPITHNGGMEALTLLDDGSLLVGIEWPFSADTAYDIWRQTGEQWALSSLAAVTEYGLTGMTMIDGQVYALQRYWTPAVGSQLRIVRFDQGALDSDETIEPELLAEFGAANSVDNFEGITAFHRDGETILLIVSDDNYNPQQRTLLMAFAVTG
ncbi:esterase-like activity of phytase family protein [Maricaulis sp.]|uniref:esterase-like activity of phytase family protein n=1 Tax=Maricaulis sp. TaxID=1486257 RepID=UPI003A8CF500